MVGLGVLISLAVPSVVIGAVKGAIAGVAIAGITYAGVDAVDQGIRSYKEKISENNTENQ